MERSLSQPTVRRRWENTRTHSVGLLRDYSILESCNGCCNANDGGGEGGGKGGRLQRRQGDKALVAGIGKEGFRLSQPVRQRSKDTRTHCTSLLGNYSIIEPASSSCKGTCSRTPAAASLGPKDDDDGKKIHRKPTRMKLSMRTLAIAACFGGIGGLITVLLSSLPSDFESRWRMLFEDAQQDGGSSQGGPQSPTVLFDRYGTVIATIAPRGYIFKQADALPQSSGRSESTMGISIAEIPSWMWQAVVASEDRRFFKHQGVDPRGLARAVLSLASRGGGSTITQQLIKNVVLTNERKWTRKLSEMILALVLEKQMSKWDILHCYLKKIYWGHGVYGIEAASALYFGKHPSLLTLGECAMLAGIIPAPELLSPYRDPSRGKKAQGRALRRMVESGFLDTAGAVEALRQPLKLASEINDGISGPWKAPYFVSEVLSELTLKYGWSKVASGGLQVHTTLDLSMQIVAEKLVLDHLVEYDRERILLADEGLQKTRERLEGLQIERQGYVTKVVKGAIRSEDQSGHFVKKREEKKLAAEVAESETREERGDMVSSSAAVTMQVLEEYLQARMSEYEEEIKAAQKSRMEAAMVAIDPFSGGVRVLVGGRDYYESNFNRGTEAFRSAGSTLEPVVHLTALAEGLKRDHVLLDEPFTKGGFLSECYDREFCGKVTLEESLVHSLKVPTMRLCAEVGVDKDPFSDGRNTILISGSGHLGMSCFQQVTPMQLATVYATIAAGGVYNTPHFITRIESQEGHILEEHEASKSEQQVPIVNQRAVAELRRLLQAAVDRGTGAGVEFGRACAGKAGTSNEHKDVWFAGFTPEISCVVWLGYDDYAPVGGLHPATGASHAAPLFRKFMKTVHEEAPVRKFRDRGFDQDGSRAPKKFVRRSRRMPRIGLHKIRKARLKRKEHTPLRQVWDWERASVGWIEQEKMDAWIANSMEKAARSSDSAGLL